MQQTENARGLALLCDLDGVVLQVLHNDFDLGDAGLSGKSFPALVAKTSFQKALSLLVKLRNEHSVFDWELELECNRNIVPVHCVGVLHQEDFLILAAETRSAIHVLFEDMVRINNAHTDLVRKLAKERNQFARAQTELEKQLDTQVTLLQDQILLLQVELENKTQQVEQLNRRVAELTAARA